MTDLRSWRVTRKLLIPLFIFCLLGNSLSSARGHHRADAGPYVDEAPVMMCTIPASGKIDVTIIISCSSDISMSSTDVWLYQLGGNGWQIIQRNTVSGKKFEIYFVLVEEGVAEVKVLYPGLQDDVSTWWSNTMSIKISNPSSNSSKISNPPSNSSKISNPPLNSSKWIKEGYAAIMERSPDLLYKWGITNTFGATGKPVKAKMETFCKKFTVWELEPNNVTTSLSKSQKILARKYWNQGCVEAGMKLKLSNFKYSRG
jgi:hypothetical protein